MRKALVVGINDYDNINPLNWCENDAMGMSQALERHASGDPNFSTQLLTTNNKMPLTGRLTRAKNTRAFLR